MGSSSFFGPSINAPTVNSKKPVWVLGTPSERPDPSLHSCSQILPLWHPAQGAVGGRSSPPRYTEGGVEGVSVQGTLLCGCLCGKVCVLGRVLAGRGRQYVNGGGVYTVKVLHLLM